MDAADPQDVAEARELTLDELDRMHRMVEDLVTLAKVNRPDFVTPRPVEVGRLLDDVLDKSRALADRQWRVDGRVEAVITLDQQRITQALLQLVSNAVKFTDVGDTIAIGSQLAGSGVDVIGGQLAGSGVKLWVRDTGAGIAPEDLERIFDRFARIDTGRGVDGSGLGLAIVRGIAEAHHGTVSVQSTPGRGSVFNIWLPASGPVDVALADAVVEAPASDHDTAVDDTVPDVRTSWSRRPR